MMKLVMKVSPSRSHCGLESLYIDNLIAISKTKTCSNLVLQIRGTDSWEGAGTESYTLHRLFMQTLGRVPYLYLLCAHLPQVGPRLVPPDHRLGC